MFTHKVFSEHGSNSREKEEATFMFLFQNVFIIGDDENSVKLETIVAFFTGADAVPPLGYPSITLHFSEENIYPTASTCAIVLTLPTKHQTYDVFKQLMMFLH